MRLLALLLLLSGCGPTYVYRDHGGGMKPECNRASCWDDKSGRFLGSDEWNRRHR